MLRVQMKPISLMIMILAALTAGCNAIAADMSLVPYKACSSSRKAPPDSVLNKSYSGNTTTNGPFVEADITGDGLCDWIGTGAQPPHISDSELPEMKDFIFVATKSGWRRFGDMKKWWADPARGRIGDWLTPENSADAFIGPTVIYVQGGSAPYVAALSMTEDRMDYGADHINVYQWDSKYSLLRIVGDAGKRAVIGFLKSKCAAKSQAPGGLNFEMHEALCRSKD